MADDASSSMDGPPDLLDSARLVGGYAWLERRLFEVIGGWVASTPEPAVAALFDAHALHHAWYSSVFTDRLPHVREIVEDQVVVAPDAGSAALLDGLADGGTGTIERLSGTYRMVVPLLLVTYTDHLGRLTPVADEPLRRWLGMVITDLSADWVAGESLLRSLVGTSAEVDRAVAVQARLESILVASDGPSGPG